jgi:hypothetical protein
VVGVLAVIMKSSLYGAIAGGGASGPVLPAYSALSAHGVWPLRIDTLTGPWDGALSLNKDLADDNDGLNYDVGLNPNPPYSANWTALINVGVGPYKTFQVCDQSGYFNNFVATGGDRATLQYAASMIVTGIGAGTYTFRGIDYGGSELPYYNLVGQPDQPALSSLISDITLGTNHWNIYNAAGDYPSLNTSTSTGNSLPSQATWTGSTVTAGPPLGFAHFDGTNGYVTDVEPDFANSNNISIFWVGRVTDWSAGSVLMEYDSDPGAQDNVWSLEAIDDGKIRFSQYQNSGSVLNSALADVTYSTDWLVIFGTIDNRLSAANQTKLWVNSVAGIHNDNNDCGAYNFGTSAHHAYLGARNQTSMKFIGDYVTSGWFGSALSDGDRQAMEAWLTYLTTLL